LRALSVKILFAAFRKNSFILSAVIAVQKVELGTIFLYHSFPAGLEKTLCVRVDINRKRALDWTVVS
jgi:hypothetical protein